MTTQANTRCRMASTPAELEAAKRLDDLAFGSHHGITMRELKTIMFTCGFVALLYHEDQLVAESQILHKQIEEMKGFELPRDAAFCYGIATHPDFQGRGFGKELLTRQDEIAILRGARIMYTTVRVENYPSLKLFMSHDYRIIDYIPFYGESAEDHRFLLMKDLVMGNSEAVSFESPILVNVSFGDAIDLEAHKRTSSLLKDRFLGVSLSKEGILFARI